jgi:phosphohistidine phosphatase
MKLYFLRHATAEDIAASDAKRELTKEGREEARVAGAALSKLGVKPGHVLSSPLVRALQTSELAAKAMRWDDDVLVLNELENGSTTAQLLRALRPYRDDNEIVLVGHMPSLSDHIAELIDADNPEALALGKGSIACVELEQLRAGNATLRWLMRQKQLRELIG